jgi:hypothetical protein
MYLIWLYGKVRGILLTRVGEGESKELSLNSKGGQVMAKYQVKMIFNYVIDTDNLEATRNSYEFPVFPNLPDQAVEFDGGWADWKEIA